MAESTIDLTVDFDPPKRKRRSAPGEVSGTRKENDTYDTPPELARACVEWIVMNTHHPMSVGGPGRPACVLDPTAGGGPFVRAVRETLPNAKIGAGDIREECREPCKAAGANGFFLGNALWAPIDVIAKLDLIVTNPPFILADALVRHFWASMSPGAILAFLLNVTFIGSEDRWIETKDNGGEPLFKIAPLAYVVPIVPRPSFLKIDGKSTSPKFEAALFVWQKGAENQDPYPTVIPGPIRWEKEKKGASR